MQPKAYRLAKKGMVFIMRRKDREITKKSELINIIEQCKVLRLAMQDQEGLYIVPLNFGYEYDREQPTFYIHSAVQGRKIKALSDNTRVAFEMDCEHRLVEAEKACDYGYEYKSIIGNGVASFVLEYEEKKQALSLLMKHQTGKEFIFTEQETDTVAVIKIEVSSICGKCLKK
jgi:Predicted flavin-nucleotide-binding protein